MVILSPFLTMLERDDDASVVHRAPIIYGSAASEQLLGNVQMQLLSALPSDTKKILDIIEIDLREAAKETWSY